jgi:hypothetical protein
LIFRRKIRARVAAFASHLRASNGREGHNCLAEKFALRLIQRMIPESKRAQIIAALKANPNLAAVARKSGVSTGTVGRIAKKAKIDVGKSGPKKVSAEKRAQIIAALKANPNATAVAREIGGISDKLVGRLAKKAKIALGRARGKAS